MEIGIVGGAGGMGHWVAAFLQRNGYIPHLIDTNPDVFSIAKGIECNGIHIDGDPRCMLKENHYLPYDVLIIAVPLNTIPSSIAEYSPLLKPSSLLMDIGSLKTPALKAMEQYTPDSVHVLPTHPLFGVRFESFAGLTCVLTKSPARPMGPWADWWENLVKSEKGNIVEASAAEHDEMMLTAQVLVHYIAIVIGVTLKKMKVDLNRLQSFKTPPFETLASIVGRLFSAKRKNIYWDIQQHPQGDVIRACFAEAAGDFADQLSKCDINEFVSILDSTENYIGSSLAGYSHNAEILFSQLAAGQRALYNSVGKSHCIMNVGSKNKTVHHGQVENVNSDKLLLRTRRDVVTFSTKSVRLLGPEETLEWVSTNLPLKSNRIVVHCHKVLKPSVLVSAATGIEGIKNGSIFDIYNGNSVPKEYNKVTLRLEVLAEP